MDQERQYLPDDSMMVCPECGVFPGQYHDQLCKLGKEEEKDETIS